MQKDKEKWNQKYQERELKLLSPEPLLCENINLLKPGTVMDLACGDGRNALYLAQHDFEVTGVDISELGLKRLQNFAHAKNLIINTREIDLDFPEELLATGQFDNIVISHYKPSEALWKIIPDLLKTEGIVFLCTFNIRQSEVYDFSRRFCLEDKELFQIHPQLSLLDYQQVFWSEKYLDIYIFQKSEKILPA